MARYDMIACYIMANAFRGTIYVGVTSDLFNRALEHRERRGSFFTTKYKCAHLVWWEPHGDITSAIAREKQIKAWRRARKVQMIEAVNPDWRDIYRPIAAAEPGAPARTLRIAVILKPQSGFQDP
jgi:putative endonuclease